MSGSALAERRQRELLDSLRDPPDSLWDRGDFVLAALAAATVAGYLLGRRRT